MKHLRLLSLGLVLVMVLTPMAVFAQDDGEIELEEFTTEDGLLTIGYPKDWFIEPNDMAEDGIPGVMLANTEDTLASMTDSEDTEATTNLAEGEAGIIVLILPVDLLPFMDIEVPTDGELDLAAAATGFVQAILSEDEQQEAEFSEAETVEIGEGDAKTTAGYLEFTDPDIEGVVWLFEVNEGALALVLAGAYPGEFTDELEQTALAVAESIEFTATGTELFTMMMNSAGGDYTGGETAALDGDALVSERCTVCHSRDRIDAADKDEDGWTATVERMMGKGAQLNDEEKAAVIQYLVETH